MSTGSVMQEFWDRVNNLLEQHNAYADAVPGCAHELITDGYIRIVAHGIEYRSLPSGRNILWVSWEPFCWVAHFSLLDDPHASVEWIPFEEGRAGV